MKRKDVRFLTARQVLRAHAEALRVAGGAAGVREPGLVASAVSSARYGYHEDLASIAAAYVYSLTKNHAFVDGPNTLLTSVPRSREHAPSPRAE
jgi:death-on-curing protein